MHSKMLSVTITGIMHISAHFYAISWRPVLFFRELNSAVTTANHWLHMPAIKKSVNIGWNMVRTRCLLTARVRLERNLPRQGFSRSLRYDGRVWHKTHRTISALIIFPYIFFHLSFLKVIRNSNNKCTWIINVCENIVLVSSCHVIFGLKVATFGALVEHRALKPTVKNCYRING